MRLRIWPVGGLSSAAQDVPPSAALSLSHTLFGAENIYSYGCSARTLLQHPGLRTFYEGFRTDRASGYEIHLYIRSRVLPLALPWGGSEVYLRGARGAEREDPLRKLGVVHLHVLISVIANIPADYTEKVERVVLTRPRIMMS